MKPFDRDAAQTIAISALAFLADDPDRLGPFLVQSGMGPDELKAGAREDDTLASVLDFVMQDEVMVLEFASAADISPEWVATAHLLLSDGALDPDKPIKRR